MYEITKPVCPVNFITLVVHIDCCKSVIPVNSNKPIYPVDISVGPVDVCKAVSLVNIWKPFLVDYWRHVSLFFISLFFEVSINTSTFNRTTLYMILFINIHIAY